MALLVMSGVSVSHSDAGSVLLEIAVNYSTTIRPKDLENSLTRVDTEHSPAVCSEKRILSGPVSRS